MMPSLFRKEGMKYQLAPGWESTQNVLFIQDVKLSIEDSELRDSVILI